jgi:hypothetical protein
MPTPKINPLTLFTPKDFITEVNLAISEDPDYRLGMIVQDTGNGYELVCDGKPVEFNVASILLSRAYQTVSNVVTAYFARLQAELKQHS